MVQQVAGSVRTVNYAEDTTSAKVSIDKDITISKTEGLELSTKQEAYFILLSAEAAQMVS